MGWFSKKETKPDEPASAGSGLRLFIQKMDVSGVQAALAAGANPDGSEDDEISPLVMVSSGFTGSLPMHQRGRKEIMLLLLNTGANPRWGGKNGQSPFEIAIKKGWTEIVAKMVEKGHPLETVDGTGFTALHLVFNPVDYKQTPLLPMVAKLLSLGADPNGTGKVSRLPLVMALQQSETLRGAPDYRETIEALVNAGASIEMAQEATENLGELLLRAGLEDLAVRWGIST